MKNQVVSFLAVLLIAGFAVGAWAQEVPAYKGIDVTIKIVSPNGNPYAQKAIMVTSLKARPGARTTYMMTDEKGEAKSLTPIWGSPLIFDCTLSPTVKFSIQTDVRVDAATAVGRLSNPQILPRRSRIPAGWSASPAIEDGNKLVMTVTQPALPEKKK